MTGLEVRLGDVPVALHPSGALRWAGGIAVADLHLGKSGSFRRQGLAVPEGSDEETLTRLLALMRAQQETRLVILGDLFHSRHSLPQAKRLWQTWLTEHEIEATLVPGNHDRARGSALSWSEVPPGTEREGLSLFHHPPEAAPGPWIAGHIHPQVRIFDEQGALRVPCFWPVKAGLVLPAFGAFTGGYVIEPTPTWACLGERVIAIPEARQRTERARR
jgi:DNA ligase-associated metallophosphoesterase